MLSEKQPEYVHPRGSLTPGAVEPEDGTLLGEAAAAVGFFDASKVGRGVLLWAASLLELAGVTVARVVDFAGSSCAGAGGPLGFNPEPGQTCFVARCGPGWIGLQPGKVSRAPPTVPDPSVATGFTNPTSSWNTSFALQAFASSSDRKEPAPKH